MQEHLKAIAATGATLISAQFQSSEDTESVLIEDRESFLQVVQLARVPLVFYTLRKLGLWDFVEEDDRSVIDVPALSKFRERIGETASLHALLALGGVRVEWVALASWWPDFLELRQTAEEAQRDLQRTKAREQWERVAQALRDRLPRDDAFIALACEARPRITALRIRAEELVIDVGKVTGSLPDRTVREVAAAIKTEFKQGKLRQ